MKNNALLPIGSVAKLFHISVSTLRHYEKTGLVIPEYTDPSSGYRYYGARQFEILNTIRYLRELDMPLIEIADFLKNRDVELIEEKLLKQKEAVIEKYRTLKRIEKKIDNRISCIETAKTAELGKIELTVLPESRIVWIEDSLKIGESADLEAPIRRLDTSDAEAVVFLGKVGVAVSSEHLLNYQFTSYDGIFLILDREDIYLDETRTLEETECVRIRFCGSHSQSPQEYKKLLGYMDEHNLTVNGFSREITLIDYGITNDINKFVTEINIPIKHL